MKEWGGRGLGGAPALTALCKLRARLLGLLGQVCIQ